tara:strand:- start:229 stop:432 length:204 start_codon:yes stop_codon:yes gene_type:complete
MKILIILLLSTTGIEEVKFETNGLNCNELATAWREVNTTYHDSRNMDPKQQGNFTSDGKLMIGYICK